MPSAPFAPGTARERSLPDLLRRLRRLPRGAHLQLRGVAFMSTYGFGPAVEQWGGFLSDVVRVPYAEHMLVPLPAGVEPAAVASASDNLATRGARSARRSPSGRGRRCSWSAAPGRGSIGLYAAALAVALGAESVTYLDPDARRREIAAGSARTRSQQAPERLGPFPITVDAVRRSRRLALALHATAPDGCARASRSTSASSRAAAALDVHEGHHVQDRPRERARGHASRARADRQRRAPPGAGDHARGGWADARRALSSATGRSW